jgi:hypothetical protein
MRHPTITELTCRLPVQIAAVSTIRHVAVDVLIGAASGASADTKGRRVS